MQRLNLFADQNHSVVIEMKSTKSELIAKLNLLTEQIYNQISNLGTSLDCVRVMADALRTGKNCTRNDPYQLKELKQIVDRAIQKIEDEIERCQKQYRKTVGLTLLAGCLLQLPDLFTERAFGKLILLGCVLTLLGGSYCENQINLIKRPLPALNYLNEVLASAKDYNDELAKLLCEEKNPDVTMQAEHVEQIKEVYRTITSRQRKK